MKSKRLTIVINKPLGELFEFTLDPTNTPKWIDGIAEEHTNEWPSKLGTIYKNRSINGVWNEYELVDFKQDETFTLSRKNGDYHVRYSFRPISDRQTEFEYYEWVSEGQLDDTFSQEVLEKLKDIVENEN